MTSTPGKMEDIVIVSLQPARRWASSGSLAKTPATGAGPAVIKGLLGACRVGADQVASHHGPVLAAGCGARTRRARR